MSSATSNARVERAYDEEIVIVAVDAETETAVVENRKDDDDDSKYVVDFGGRPPEAVRCSCPDHKWRDTYCKHMVALDRWLDDESEFDAFFRDQ